MYWHVENLVIPKNQCLMDMLLKVDVVLRLKKAKLAIRPIQMGRIMLHGIECTEDMRPVVESFLEDYEALTYFPTKYKGRL